MKRLSGVTEEMMVAMSPADTGGRAFPFLKVNPEALGSEPMFLKGDMFKAKPRPNVPEREKPTLAQRRARAANIKKAQAARHTHGK
jgi:hypothetical protein